MSRGLIFAAAFGFWLAYGGAPQGVESDFWWHLKAGQLLLAGHAPFTTDPFSWTASGRPWVQHEWLGEALLAAIYRLGGEAAVHLAYRGLLAALFLVVAAIFLRGGCNLALAGLGALFVDLHLYAQLWPRMQGFTLLGMALTCLLLAHRWAGGRLGGFVWAYPLGVAIWANLHAGVIAGPLSCTLALLADVPKALGERLGPPSPRTATRGRVATPPDRREVLEFGAMTALAWLAILVNPIGADLARFILATLTDPEYRAFYAMTAEWGPFKLSYSTCQYFAFWTVAVIACAILGGRSALRPGALLLALPWAVMALVSRRHVPLAAIASAPLAAFCLASAWSALFEARTRTRLALGFTASLAYLGAAVPATFDLLAGPFSTNLSVPSDAALRVALDRGRDRRMFNLYDWGGLILFHGYPEVRVFIDGRQDVYGLELNVAHHRLMGTAPGWRDELDRRGIDMVFAPAWVPIVRALSTDRGWEVAFKDRSAAVLLKNRERKD